MTDLKAYYVSCKESEMGEVVFAPSRSKAKLMTEYLNGVDFIDITAVRAPSFDDIKGPVTHKQYLERGYHTNCALCDSYIDSTSEDLCFSLTEDAYCCWQCLDKDNGIHAKADILRSRTLEDMASARLLSLSKAELVFANAELPLVLLSEG